MMNAVKMKRTAMMFVAIAMFFSFVAEMTEWMVAVVGGRQSFMDSSVTVSRITGLIILSSSSLLYFFHNNLRGFTVFGHAFLVITYCHACENLSTEFF